MKRTTKIYLDDILESIGDIESFVKGVSKSSFMNK